MKARYQYRFYPTDQQRQSLAQLFGGVRVVWNDALAFSKSEQYPGYNQLSAMLTQAKKTEARNWLTSVSSVPLQQSLKQLEAAYKNYFNSLKGKRKGQKVGQPRFKKKTNNQSATFTKAAFSLKNAEVLLAKIGHLKPIWSRDLPSAPSSVTVIKDCANRYFLSFVVEIEPVQLDTKNQSIGIDLGIKTFAVMSDGTKAVSPNYSKMDRQIRKLQKKLARQQKDSKRRERTRIQIAKLHNLIADTVTRQRNEHALRMARNLCLANAKVVLEDLNISGMVKNHKLAKSISDASWYNFRQWLNYFGEKFGREIIVAQRDVNAAKVILSRANATGRHPGSNASRDVPSTAVGRKTCKSKECQ